MMHGSSAAFVPASVRLSVFTRASSDFCTGPEGRASCARTARSITGSSNTTSGPVPHTRGARGGVAADTVAVGAAVIADVGVALAAMAPASAAGGGRGASHPGASASATATEEKQLRLISASYRLRVPCSTPEPQFTSKRYSRRPARYGAGRLLVDDSFRRVGADRTVAGRFDILRLAGAGAMGAVYC